MSGEKREGNASTRPHPGSIFAVELGTVEAQDKDPSICALAAQTSLILNCLWDKRKSRLSLHGLCPWCH